MKEGEWTGVWLVLALLAVGWLFLRARKKQTTTTTKPAYTDPKKIVSAIAKCAGKYDCEQAVQLEYQGLSNGVSQLYQDSGVGIWDYLTNR